MSTTAYKILLADDNPVNLDLATRLLKKRGAIQSHYSFGCSIIHQGVLMSLAPSSLG